MKNLTLLTILLIGFNVSSYAQNKWSFGIGAQTSQSKLKNIPSEGRRTQVGNPNPNSEIEPYLTVWNRRILSYGFSFIAERSIGTNKSLDFGVGFLITKNDLFLDTSPDTGANWIPPSLHNVSNMQRKYIYLPINFNYFPRLGSNVCLKTSLGVTANYLINVNENIEFMQGSEVYIDPYSQYNKLHLLGKAKLGLRYESAQMPVFDVNLFYNYGVNSITIKDAFAFYGNLHHSREIQYGLEVNYFFLH